MRASRSLTRRLLMAYRSIAGPLVAAGLAGGLLIVGLAGCAGRKAPEPRRTRTEEDTVLLNQRLVPDEGTWEAPVEEIGRATTEPWSESTRQNAVDGKPLDAKVTTLVGEVVDLGIYIQTGAHGRRYKKHMVESVAHGGPIGLLTGDGKCYLVLAEEYGPRTVGKTELRPILADRLGDIVRLTGTAIETGGIPALYVRGFVREEQSPPQASASLDRCPGAE
jgi:hypothetical protein